MAEIILTIVVEVVKCLAPPAYRQISYLRESKYMNNLQNLKIEVDDLKSERVRTEHQVDEAKRKGEEIEENVENWLATANNVIVEAVKFTDDEAIENNTNRVSPYGNNRNRLRLVINGLFTTYSMPLTLPFCMNLFSITLSWEPM